MNDDTTPSAEAQPEAADAGQASSEGDATGHQSMHHERKQYLRFGTMIATSTVVMFVLTYTNSYSWDHVRWSEERLYMALLMAGAMAIVMLSFMWGMHHNLRVNVAIVLGGLALMCSARLQSRAAA